MNNNFSKITLMLTFFATVVISISLSQVPVLMAKTIAAKNSKQVMDESSSFIRRIKKIGNYFQESGEYKSLAEAVQATLGTEKRTTENGQLNFSYAQTAKLVADDGTRFDYFSKSVAIDGDTAVVGASSVDVGTTFDQGAVYIFKRRGLTWSLEQKLFASDGSQSDGFGSSVAIEGDTLVVGACLDDIGTSTESNQGSVYIFTRNGTVWTEQQKLIASDASLNDWFGYSIAISNNTVVVGAYNDSIGTIFNNQGSAYIFVRSNSLWTERAKLIAKDGSINDHFGNSVAIEGETVIVGAFEAKNGTGFTHGAVYIYLRNNTSWIQSQKLTAVDAYEAGYENFGKSVAISGGTIAIGAWGDNSQQGSAYIFVRNSGTWEKQQKLVASDGDRYDYFGGSVDIDGDTLIVGAPWDNIGLYDRSGSAYVYKRQGTIWSEQAKFPPPENGIDTHFGEAVAISGGTMIISAPGNNAGLGAAYIFNDITNVPDLQAASDSGTSNSDNVTSSRTLIFNINDITIGALIELLRDGVVVDSTVANNNAIILADKTLPSDGTFRYSVRQTLSNNTILLGAPSVVTVDNTAPTGIINQAIGQDDPTRFQPVNFSVIFNEPVFGFDAADVSLIGSTANISSAVISVTGGGSFYKVSVSNVTSDGIVKTSIIANAVQDLAGNLGITASSSTDNTVYLDITAPTLTINQSADQSDPTRTLPINFTVIFSEPVTGFDKFDVSLAGSTGNVSTANITVIGSGTTYTVSISNLRLIGQTIQVSIRSGAAQDLVGNLNVGSTSSDNRVRLLSTFADFDADGKADISVFRPDNGVWYLLNSQTGFNSAQFGLSTDKIVPADYDGDGKTDIAVWREDMANPDRAYFYILNSSNNTVRVQQFGRTGDSVSAVSDWDGDGKADISVYRTGTNGGQSYFFYRPSSQPSVDFISVPWGSDGDKPVVADYDGDGKSDAAVYRPSNGVWYILKSRDGFSAVQFGNSTDKPVVGDYDGDGRADIAVYRPSGGYWYQLRSTQGFAAVQFGNSTDLPVPADYDGDGRTDVAVFRPSESTWYQLRSTLGFNVVQFGASGDNPIPNAFVP
jgi:hypothetical protein